jgi:DNA gyrase subunit B
MDIEDNKENKQYTGESIKHLKGLEAVRKTPGMYIGSTDEQGLHHMVWEIVDNAIDEAIGGYCNTIKLELLPDGVVRVTDNGRGIPADYNPSEKMNSLDMVFTELHAGGKFDKDSYKTSGGLHGVGASVVNALSTYLHVKVSRNNLIYEQTFISKDGEYYGKPIGEVAITGESSTTGTVVEFRADPDFFTVPIEYDYLTLKNRIQELAFLNNGLTINLLDLRGEEEVKDSFCYSGGIKEYVNYIQHTKEIVNPTLFYFEETVSASSARNINRNITSEISLQYKKYYESDVLSFVNCIRTTDGGTHVQGFQMALTRVLNSYGFDNKLFKKEDEKFEFQDVCQGLVSVIHVKYSDPQYVSQTKNKLGSSEVKGIVSQTLGKQLEKFLLENPNDAKLIFDKCKQALNSRLAGQKAMEATRKGQSLDFATKLADCRCKEPEKCELYIVEGNSAGGSAKQGRDSLFQAILPLRGKVLNVEKVNLSKALENKEIVSLINAIGTGINSDSLEEDDKGKNRPADFDINKLRYHKIVIMTDADVDGAHIRTLLLTFFYRMMKELVEGGFIYFAQPPLYRVKRGNSSKYLFTKEELELELSTSTSKPTIQRYKGLGEMDADQLWDTTMDPKYRTLLKVTLNDAKEADEVFSMLMGEEVPPRRDFIVTNAEYIDPDLVDTVY